MSYKPTLFQSTAMADRYVKYRPAYGPAVFEAIVSFCQETEACDFSLAVDLGCGSGQGTVPLTKHFTRVIGLDVSQAQVDRAPKDIPNLSFRVGPAEDLSFLEDDSVDLVTVAMALHWFDTEKVFLEVERVLKPGGAIVVYGYGREILHEPTAREMSEYYWNKAIVTVFPDDRQLQQIAQRRFEDFYLPFPGWHRNVNVEFERSWTVDEFVNYLSSLALPACHLPLLPRTLDSILDFIRQRLTEVYQNGPEERKIKVTWPMFMLKGRKPHPL